MARISEAEWTAYKAELNHGVDNLAEVCQVIAVPGVIMPFIAWVSWGWTGIQLLVSFLLVIGFVLVVKYAGLMHKKNKAELVVGLVAGVTGLTNVTSAAKQVGLNPIDFSRVLAELISRNVVAEVRIFPEADSFGPPGEKTVQAPRRTDRPTTRAKRDLYVYLRWLGISGGALTTAYWVFTAVSLIVRVFSAP